MWRKVRDGQGSIVVPLSAIGTPNCRESPMANMSIYFVATHFSDLQKVLELDSLE
jgi:hypothetical protein